MALIRWEPARELGTIQSEMNRLFNSFFDTPTVAARTSSPIRRWVPAIDVVESDSYFVLRADLPGLSEADVNIEVDDNVLTISGERKSEHEERTGALQCRLPPDGTRLSQGDLQRLVSCVAGH